MLGRYDLDSWYRMYMPHVYPSAPLLVDLAQTLVGFCGVPVLDVELRDVADGADAHENPGATCFHATAHPVFAAESIKPYIPPDRADEPDVNGPLRAQDAEVVVDHRTPYRRLDLLVGWESMPRHEFKYRALTRTDGFFLVVAPGPPRLRQCVLDYAAAHPELIADIRARTGSATYQTPLPRGVALFSYCFRRGECSGVSASRTVFVPCTCASALPC